MVSSIEAGDDCSIDAEIAALDAECDDVAIGAAACCCERESRT